MRPAPQETDLPPERRARLIVTKPGWKGTAVAVGTSVGRGVEVGTKVVGVVIGSGGRPSAQPARSENANDVANPNRRSSDVCPSNARLRVATTSLMLETGVKAVKISRPGKKDALTAAPSNRQSLAQATSALNAWIEVDLGALSANVAALRAITGRRRRNHRRRESERVRPRSRKRRARARGGRALNDSPSFPFEKR